MNRTLFAALFGGEGRFDTLRVLFEHSNESYGLVALAEASGVDPASLSRWLKEWTKAGLVKKEGKARAWRYRVSHDAALRPVAELFRQKSQLVERLTAFFADNPEIEVALIHGSVARGEEKEGSDIDVMVIGTASELYLNADLVPFGEEFGREIRLSVYTREEIERLHSRQDSFLMNVLRNKVILLKGNMDEYKPSHPERAESDT